MSVLGKLEATIKINDLPTPETVENGWQHFTIDCDGKEVSVTVKPKMWKKLASAAEQYDLWVAAVSGKIGEITAAGFVLESPSIQAFERKPKAPKEEKAA